MEAHLACVGADFCQEASDASDTEFSRTYLGDPQSRIIGQSENLSLLADISPLCFGHLLIISKDHYLSFAEVIKDHGTEVENTLDQVLRQYKNTFGEPVILEHGSSKDMENSACITHAHWHLLPLNLDILHRRIIQDLPEVTELGRVSDLASLAEKNRPYFYCADRFRHRVYAPGRKARRQYLRYTASALLGIPDPEWDYALVVRKDLLRRTMAAVAGWSIGPEQPESQNLPWSERLCAVPPPHPTNQPGSRR